MNRLKLRSLIALGALMTAGVTGLVVQTAEAEKLEIGAQEIPSSHNPMPDNAPAGIAPPPPPSAPDVHPDVAGEPLRSSTEHPAAPVPPPASAETPAHAVPEKVKDDKASAPAAPVPLAGEDKPVRVVPIRKDVTQVPAPSAPVKKPVLVLQDKQESPVSASKRESLNVQLDLATVIRVPKETSTIVVGNPIIADTTVQNSGLLVITGKSHGTTNVMALNSSGELIKELIVNVVGSSSAMAVTVQRGMDRETWACSPNCQRTVTLGDGDGYFSEFSSQINSRNSLSQGVVNNSASSR